jgi:hypothetical protein
VHLLYRILTTKKRFDSLCSNESNIDCRRHVKIRILCEGAPDNIHLVEYGKTKLKNTHYLHASKIIEKYLMQKSSIRIDNIWKYHMIESINVLNDTSPLNAFTSMCTAHILLTSPSSFSFSAAGLCQPPLTLAFQLSQKYEGIDGVVNIKHKQRQQHKGFWQDMASSDEELDLPNFENLYFHRIVRQD